MQNGYIAMAIHTNSDGSGNPGVEYGWGATEQAATDRLWERLRGQASEMSDDEAEIAALVAEWEFVWALPFEQ